MRTLKTLSGYVSTHRWVDYIFALIIADLSTALGTHAIIALAMFAILVPVIAFVLTAFTQRINATYESNYPRSGDPATVPSPVHVRLDAGATIALSVVGATLITALAVHEIGGGPAYLQVFIPMFGATVWFFTAMRWTHLAFTPADRSAKEAGPEPVASDIS